ncbi:hypothetical protein V8E54_001713 [Elaphomyces granulatus]
MDFPRLSSTPSIHINDCNNSHDRGLATLPMSAQSFSSPGRPMRIPTKNIEPPPPPLPPPREIYDLDVGHDPGWHYGNGATDTSTLAPINPSSSLLGGHHQRPDPVPRIARMSLDEPIDRKKGLLPQSPKARLKSEPTSLLGESFRNTSLISSDSVSKGERDFPRDAYDQRLLSKIGKPPSTPRQSVSLGNDIRSPTTSLPFHPRGFSSLQSPIGSDGAPRTSDLRWRNVFPVSPHAKSGWKEPDYRSPSVESSVASPLDFETAACAREPGRRPAGAMTPQYEDNSSLASRSNRGSYDQGVFPDVEGDFAPDEGGQPRQLQFSDRTPPSFDLTLQSKQQGMKRRASSPPREPTSDDRLTIHSAATNGEIGQRRLTGHPFNGTTSPGSRNAPNHGSLSAASSTSGRTYSSSATLSLAGSSMTSVSSYDRLSPSCLSPSSDLDQCHDIPMIIGHHSPSASLSGHSSTVGAQSSAPTDQKTPSLPKMSLQTALNVSKPGGPKIGRFICDCCPKKPKKFDTQEELRTHELEKQYSCQFCNNRFKNKNEAERHRNSLHLRRHSWSCAALSGYQAAFHSSTSPGTQTNAGPSHDTCGYCGDEFPNFPQPDWNTRIDHLTSLHKFGECNNAKKFYRADHFRQHLKHSHAGTSGKWTNILENACMKEEPPVESRLGSIGEQGGRRTGSMSSIGAGSTTTTIDEALDES